MGMTTQGKLKGLLDQELERLISHERDKLKKDGPYPLMADDDVIVCQARPFQTGDLVPE